MAEAVLRGPKIALLGFYLFCPNIIVVWVSGTAHSLIRVGFRRILRSVDKL